MFKQKKKRSREFKSSDKVIDLEEARIERRQKRREVVDKRQTRGKKTAAEELSERKINKRNKRRLIYIGVILVITAVIGVSVFHVYSLRTEYKDITAENKALQKTKQDLIEELGNVNNPEYIEEQARKQLRMVKPGEVLYILPTEETSKAALAPTDGAKLLPAGDAAD